MNTTATLQKAIILAALAFPVSSPAAQPGAPERLAAIVKEMKSSDKEVRLKAVGKLVQHGICAQIRHPLYTSVLLAGFAWALLWQSAPALAAAGAVLGLTFIWLWGRWRRSW